MVERGEADRPGDRCGEGERDEVDPRRALAAHGDDRRDPRETGRLRDEEDGEEGVAAARDPAQEVRDSEGDAREE